MVIDTKRLGYGGSAEIAGQQVLITSGTFTNQGTPTFIDALSIPPTTASRSRMLHADGVSSYSGQLSLDVTDSFLNVLTTSTLLGRRYLFDVGINDGEDTQELTDCYVTSLSLNGTAGGLISASISFLSPNSPVSSISVANAFIRDDEPLGYWYSGNTDVRDWTFSMNQAVTPVYGNENTMDPRYMKVGLVEYSLAVTTFDAIVAHSTINIKTSSFTLTGVTTAQEYAFAGITDIGNYRHTFESAASASGGSGGIIIS